MRVLAGDIGGTNARLAIADLDDGAPRIVTEQRYPSSSAPGLAPIVRRFLDWTGARVERACFGIAGPVVDGECRTPNLPWTVSARDLARDLGIASTTIINDFVAAAHGVACLGPRDLVTLQEGKAEAHGTIALIGAGTGLGEGFLTWDGARYRVHASEGGHTDFAAGDQATWTLRQALLDEFGRVSWERVLSGAGLAQLYRHFAASGAAPEQPSVRREMEREDPAAVVTRHALAGDDAISAKALEAFVAAYGAQAGNLALTVLATGGVYLAGGIAPRIVAKLKDGTFLAAFRNKGRMADLMGRMPVHVIVSPDVGLLGAARAAAE
jgi:glucokinase